MMTTTEKQLGKIGIPIFDSTIASMKGYKRQEVRRGPQFGVDVSLVDLPGGISMAMTSDPLSLIPSLGLEASAWLSVHLMANDMATTGHAPMYGQFVLNLPTSLTKEDFKQYWSYIHRFCVDIGVAITGGHTGFVEHQNSTISGGGTFVAIAPKGTMRNSTDAREGDVLLVTKQFAISSTAILAMSFPQTVQNKVGTELYQLACNSFYQTSSLKDALTAVENNEHVDDVSDMHDVTEGGVLGAIYELANASHNGVVIDSDKLPVSPVQDEICKIFGLDYRYCVGAGSMVIACREAAAQRIIHRLKTVSISCVEVGRLTNISSGIKLIEQGFEKELTYYEDDPYWAAFYHACERGWK
ncbi:AIR synthase-related protein [Sphingobacterium wenxiniae]|nr:AIR synthase-related protein [Sphingobacterium wenxiniae]